MTTLVIGASGATGKHLVNQLLEMDQKVKVIVRSTASIPEEWKKNQNLNIIKANVSEISINEMVDHVNDCDAVASCLGHNLSFKGLYGKPRKLVTDAVKLMCDAIERVKSDKPKKFVLMNTVANMNKDLKEPYPKADKFVIFLLRYLLPPQSDNELAADYLRTNIGKNHQQIEWTAVRPDALIDQDEVSGYELYPSPITSPVFKSRKISRINVGHFMAKLIVDDELWQNWKGQMPVVYNKD